MRKPWFKVKRFGYGAGLPCAWQGWAVLAGHLLLILAAAAILGDRPLPLSIVVISATLGVVWIAWKTSDAPWRWRNGDED
ncbi:MAG: hypothetical protein QM608_01955 [Caulobacter sp.]